MDVLTIGETMVLVAPNAGEALNLGSSFRLAPGGAESNVAIQCSRLGLRTAWMSVVGSDPLGDLVIEGVARYGVDVDLVQRSADAPTAVYFKNPRPDRTDVFYYRRGSAASTMDTQFLQSANAVRPRVVLVSGVTAALSATSSSMVSRIVADRYFGEALVAFDVNYRPRLWPSWREAATALLQLARKADAVFVGRDEAGLLWGTRTSAELRALLPDAMHLVIKDADVDATEYAGSAITVVPAQAVDVVESVGAGDAFAAGWLTAYLEGGDAELRLRSGHASAASVLTSTTDQAADVDAVLALLASRRG